MAVCPIQSRMDAFPEKNLVESRACRECGFHAKTESQLAGHEHQVSWTVLRWLSQNQLNESPAKFSIVEPLIGRKKDDGKEQVVPGPTGLPV